MDKYAWLKFGLLLLELLACIIGFSQWKKIRGTYWCWFPWYLLTIVCAEVIGMSIRTEFVSLVVYNYFAIPLAFLFFTWLFYQHFLKGRERHWIVIGAAVYVVSWLTEMFFLRNTQFNFFSFSYTVGNVMLAAFVLLFFIRFINSDKILGYRKNMMFWVCCGLLIFYLGSLPLYGLWNTLARRYQDVFNTYWMIHLFFDYSMYCFFSIAFIWGKPKS